MKEHTEFVFPLIIIIIIIIIIIVIIIIIIISFIIKNRASEISRGRGAAKFRYIREIPRN